MIGALREAADDAGVAPGELDGVGVGSPGAVDDEAGTVTSARNLPDWEGTLPRWRRSSRRAFARAGRALQRRQRRHRWPSSRSAPASRTARSSASSGAPASAAGWCSTAQLWDGPRRRGRDRPHGRQERRRASARAGGRGCMEAYAGRGAMEVRAREKADDGREDRPVRDHGGAGKPRLTSGVWERALERDDKVAHKLVERAVQAIGVGRRLRRQPARRRGGDHRRRPRAAPRRSLRRAHPRRRCMPHLFADHRPPEVLLASLGDLGGAIGATLLAAERAPLAHS